MHVDTHCTVRLACGSNVERVGVPIHLQGLASRTIPPSHSNFPAWDPVLALSLLKYIMLANLLSVFLCFSLSTHRMGITPNRLLLVLKRNFLKFIFIFGCTERHVGSQFPNQGLNSCPLYWEHRVLTTRPPGKSLLLVLNELLMHAKHKAGSLQKRTTFSLT